MFSREDMKKQLHAGPCKVVFTKADGTERTMRCSLEEQYTSKYERKTDRGANPDDNLLTVWDIDKDAWRAFHVDKVVEFSPVAE